MDFRIGTSKVDITPNYGSPTRRWHLPDERARIAEIRRPLHARTVALSDGQSITTITSLEVACLYKFHFDQIRRLVREMSPAPIGTLILHNTHQHSDSFVEYEPAYDVFGINDIAFDMDHVAALPRRIASGICLAATSLTPAVAGSAAGAVEEGIAACRRTVMPDGTLVWRSSRPSPELRALPRGHIDPEVGVLTFTTPDGRPLATLYNYACHPSAAGGDSPNVCSADYPGFASNIIESTYGGLALFLHGCSGDINPGKYVRGDSFDPDDRIADAERMGRIMAGEVLKTIGRIETKEPRRITVATEECLLPLRPEANNVEQALETARSALDAWKRDGSDPRTALRKYVLSRKLVDGACPVDLFALRLDDTAAAFIPGEPFTELGERIKSASSARTKLVASTCGEDPFYMPTAPALAQGGYETGYVASEQTGETLVQAASRLLRRTEGTEDPR